MVLIEYTGIKDLKEEEQSRLKDLVLEYADKLDSKLKADAKLEFGVKVYNEKKNDKNERKKFVFNLKLNAPYSLIIVEASDWDLEKTGHKAMKKLENGLKTKIKGIERGYKKVYEK